MTQDVFISYAKEDKQFADIACSSLESEGITCWIAPRNVLPGRTWGESINNAINESKVMVVIFSSNANNSRYITREVNHAVETGLSVITVRVEDVEPSGALELYLDVVHWLDAIDPPLQKQLPRLNENVRELLQLPTPKAPPAPLPRPHGIPKWSIWLGAGLVAIVLMIFVLSVIKGKDDKGANVNHPEPTASPTRSSDSSPPHNTNANGNSTIAVPNSPAPVSTAAPPDDTSSRINDQAKVLGDPNANTAQQVNAIYALGPLAAKSLEYQTQVVNILATHIRTYAKWQGGTNRADKPAPDNIQAAITVLGGRKWTYGNGETQRLDFSGLDLRGVVFRIEGKRANFDGARLRGAHLNEAILMQTDFRNAILSNAIMKGADVNQADFCGADLSQVDARESELAPAWHRNTKCEP